MTATAAEARTWRPPPQEPLGLIVVAVSFLAAAFLANLVVMAAQVGGASFADEARVLPNGEPHSVPVSEGRDAMLWTPGAYASVSCTFTDPRTGSALPTVSTDRSYRREDDVVEWVGVATLEPISDTVTVSCVGPGRAAVFVEPAPRLPAALTGVGARMLFPGLLALAGVVAIAVALTRMRRPRRLAVTP